MLNTHYQYIEKNFKKSDVICLIKKLLNMKLNERHYKYKFKTDFENKSLTSFCF